MTVVSTHLYTLGDTTMLPSLLRHAWRSRLLRLALADKVAPAASQQRSEEEISQLFRQLWRDLEKATGDMERKFELFDELSRACSHWCVRCMRRDVR